MILYLFIFLAIIFIIYYCVSNKVKIKFKTFFKKGFKVNKGIYGIYCYCGFQGNGKTYSCVEYVLDNYKNILLFSNVLINNIDMVYYKGFDQMLMLRDKIDYAKSRKNNFIIWNNKKVPLDFSKQIVFIYDEIFSELQRGSRINTNVLDFITQMRKRGFILLTTAQIWNDIPITWRRLTRYQIDCKLIRFFCINILIKIFHDAELMKWSNDDQDFIAPIISTTISHTRKYIADSYDTYQLIHNKHSTSFDDEVSNETSSDKEDFPQGGDRGVLKLDKYFWYNDEIKESDIENEEETRTNN
ncbi:hypothetical protein [Campylobacter sp.]|uniref:hypothetical protein n=1 Tax=Campylobacter sp. TaxID=205 RepID=UPI0025863919|nr:hypothetical protein [Campylobacter sp.]MCI6641440.1 hypothetical protein [Campylobacter sp.]